MESPDPTTSNDQVMLITWLATHDASCPACKYNLRHLTQPRCPECGHEISLSIITNQRNLSLWGATTALIWANVGFGSLIWVGLLTSLFRPYSVISPQGLGDYCMLAFYLAAVPAALALVLLRGPFVRMNRAIQLAVLIFVALVTLVGLISIAVSLYR